MALILVRGENNSKLLNAIADIERHANLNLITKPKKVDAKFADEIVEKILKAPLRTKSNVDTAFHVKEDIALAILQIKKIHPPAHVVVVSDEYDGYKELNESISNSKVFKGYYSNKSKKGSKLKDYKVSAKEKEDSKSYRVFF
ncbi:MAG: DUF356 domain-containing protein [archaeon]|nr:DUF356 domain-containing protein [archaeon]